MTPDTKDGIVVAMTPAVTVVAMLACRIPAVAETTAKAALRISDVDRLAGYTDDIELGQLVGCQPGENLSVPLAQSTVNAVGVSASL